MASKIPVLVCITFAAAMAGCGGSGDSGPPPPPPVTTFPVAAAINSYYQANHSFTLTASVGANTYTLSLTITPGQAAMFENQMTSTAMLSATISLVGGSSQSATATAYFAISPFTEVGSLINTGTNAGQYSVYSNQQALPATATVGQSGSFDEETTYTDNTKSTVYSNTVDTWSLAAASSTTGWFCLNSSTTIVGGAASSESDCYQVDATGNVLAEKAVVSVNGQAVTFK